MIAPIVALLAVEAPRFAPPEGRSFQCTLSETRGQGAAARTFGLRRRIVFRRAGDGWIAEVTLIDVHADRDDPVARRYLTGTGGLRGITLRYHIAPDGTVRGLEDEAVIWAAWRRGVLAMFGRAGGVVPDPLAAMPEAQRRALLYSMIAPVLGDADLALAPGEGRVRVPVEGATGGGQRLDGTRRVRDTVRDRRTIIVHAESADGGVAIDRTRIVDSTTGLVMEERETRRITIGDAVETIRSTMTLTLEVS